MPRLHFWLIAISLCSALPLAAQLPATFGRGGISPELMRFLQLSPEQASAIDRLAAAWNADLQAKTRRAGQIPRSAGGQAALESLCREATASRDTLMQKTRALLTPEQLGKLQLLDDALNLLPRVLEAQRAGLLADSLETSPIGMPGGQITVGLAFTAGPPKPLPGCPPAQTEVRPGIVH
jgi:hypothetical protein